MSKNSNIAAHTKNSRLKNKLNALIDNPPPAWRASGVNVRPNLHGMLRYPAMMVPSMQGDILDTIISSTEGPHHVIDPFVGSGTILTEAMLRGIDFTGVDINPLAALVCEAKRAVDHGTDFQFAATELQSILQNDCSSEIDISFPNLAKWFCDDVAIEFSKLRRAICKIEDVGARKILWVVFSETVRLCSNSRTSTYKLHKRANGDTVDGKRVGTVFKQALSETCERVIAYREAVQGKRENSPSARIICGDIRTVDLAELPANAVMVTSPPYGDNTTTIPYGQFSYLALRWIPHVDLPAGFKEALLENTHALDAASLGGSLKDSGNKSEAACLISQNFADFVQLADSQGKASCIGKVASFVYDYFDALAQVHSLQFGKKNSTHWVITTGNRTVGGITVPFAAISRDIVQFLGGREVASVVRVLPTKRMPSRNSLGTLINSETTLIAEFA